MCWVVDMLMRRPNTGKVLEELFVIFRGAYAAPGKLCYGGVYELGLRPCIPQPYISIPVWQTDTSD